MGYVQMKKLKVMITILLIIVLNQKVYALDIITPSDKEKESFLVSGCPEIVASSAIVVDVKTGYTLYEKNIYDKKYPASITKIMTATLALERLKLTDTITFSHDAVFTIEPGSSSGYLDEGEQITVEQALYGLMLISGNDLANGLSEAVAGSMSEFSVLMTEKAKELGCKNTNFVNAHGLHDENHYTCAYDMAIIARNIYNESEMFRKLCSTVKYTVPPTNKQSETRYWRNSNRMIVDWEEYYYPDCVGGKTGFTNEAGGTFVSFSNINGRLLMTVILQSTNSAGAYKDSIALYDYMKANINTDIYSKMDKLHSEKIKKENLVISESKLHTVSTNKVINEERVEGSIFPMPLKIVLFVLMLFVIYYFYVRYTRFQKRKRRRRRYT